MNSMRCPILALWVKAEDHFWVPELVNSSRRATNSKRRPVGQDSLSLVVSSGFITFWTGTWFA